MSFLTSPDHYTFESPPPECGTCYPTGETPTSLFCSLQGIKIGDTWGGSDEPPPNGVFELTYTGGCQWNYSVAPLAIQCRTSPGAAVLVASLSMGGFAFSGTAGGACEIEFSNFWTTPSGVNYYGGSAVVLNPLGSGALNNPDLMDLAALDPYDDYFCGMNRPEVGYTTNRYTLKNGRTNILIKFEIP